MKLKTIVFVCGAAVMVLEIAGSRIIAPCFGNSLFTWSSLIGVVLGSLSLGYYRGGKLADRNPNSYALSMIILQAGIFIAIIPLFSSIILQPKFTAFFGMKYGPLVAVIILFAAPSVFLGMVSPYAVKLETKNLGVLGNVTGNLYAISTLGSIFGTFITAFVLIPGVGVKLIVYALSLVLISTALFCGGRRLTQGTFIALSVFSILVAITSVYAPVEDSRYKLIFQGDTPYHQIGIRDWVNSTKRTMHLDASFSGGAYLDSDEAACIYTDYFHLPFVLNPGIKEVLFLGCGPGTGPKRFHEEYGSVNMDVVDIDPVVIETAMKYFYLKEEDRLRLYVGDGRAFLADSGKRYDLIVMDVFNSVNSVPFHLMTEEFIREADEHLTEEGVVVLNLHASVKGPASKLFRAEYKTYKLVFPNVYVFPVGGDPEKVQNIIIIASKSEAYYSKEGFRRRAKELSEGIGITKLDGYLNHYLEGDISDDAPVLTDDYAPVDNLLCPVLEARYAGVWNK